MLEVTELNTFYGKNIHALKNISIKIEKGEIVALVGNNGAGKTTLMNTIMGLIKSESGSILYNNKKISGLLPYKIVKLGLSLSPEGREVFPNLTTEENLFLGSYIMDDRKKVNTILENVYVLFPILKNRRKQFAGTLSGGEQQMLAIGRALMSSPELLLLDEPSLGLAPNIVMQIFNLIKVINSQGVTVLLVEQNANMALKISNRGYVMETGKIHIHDTAENLLNNDDVKKAYLGLGM